ncbi:MAG: nucleotidyltransferase family protein [Lachnospiraceae bacterium]|nr:nucleotidyltransferase family protein [Lachnospiraceae bacterium]MBD5483209.1 nucleotidyltransferase family protein [Lachnospiraceae bacterium]
MEQKLSNEEQMVVALAAVHVDRGSIEKMDIHSLDWNMVMKIAKEQDVYTIVCHNVERFIYFSEEIHIDYQYLKYREIYKKIYRTEMKKLERALDHAGVRVLFFKGYVLDKTIYHGLRDYLDVDISVDNKNYAGFLKILDELGYISVPHNTELGMDEAFFQTAEMVGESIKTVGRFEICIDIHKVADRSPDYLNYFWSDSDLNKWACAPRLFDHCILSCRHAWRHYPHPYRMIEHRHSMTLKNLMDIRELYYMIRQDDKELEFFQYANKIKAINVVNEMLYLTERIYGGFVSEQFKFSFFNRVKHDYDDGLIISKFEDRLFYKKEEKEKAIILTKKHLEMLADGKEMDCRKILNETCKGEAVFVLPTKITTTTCGYWYDIYGGHCKNMHEKQANIGLYWNDKSFVLIADIEESDCSFLEDDNYDEARDCIMLNFVSQDIMLQINPGNHNKYQVYRVLNEKRIRVEECLFDIQLRDEGYRCVICIPWDFLKMIPYVNYIFTLYINFYVGKAIEFGKDILMPFGYSTNVKITE